MWCHYIQTFKGHEGGEALLFGIIKFECFKEMFEGL